MGWLLGAGSGSVEPRPATTAGVTLLVKPAVRRLVQAISFAVGWSLSTRKSTRAARVAIPERKQRMASLVLKMSISLDGYVAPADDQASSPALVRTQPRDRANDTFMLVHRLHTVGAGLTPETAVHRHAEVTQVAGRRRVAPV